MDIAVSVKDLTKKYKLYEDKWGPIKEIILKKNLHNEFQALKNISLDFPKGESIGVLGKNGSGKSTLLKIITGIADPTSGSVEVEGSLVFLDVSSGIDSELSGYDNIFMKGTLLGYTREEMQEKVDDIIAFSELEEFIHQPVKNYSSGMKAKLGFAISVNVNPDILIVDEALAVGDSVFREKCMVKMNEFKEEGKTIIFVSHDKNAVESFCSKAAWINKGELVMYGDSKDVGFYYNKFMSGKQSLESIKAEIAFSHRIESVELEKNTEEISLSLTGYLYGDSSERLDFQWVIQNNRTGETLTQPLVRDYYRGEKEIPESEKPTAGFSIHIDEEKYPDFFTPDEYSFHVRHCLEDGSWVQFPLQSGMLDISGVNKNDKNTGRFKTSLLIKGNVLNLKVENKAKLQEQVNKITYTGNQLHIEGIAFIRDYETPEENSASIYMILKERNTFHQIKIPVSMNPTMEVTKNLSFNPDNKNYKYAKFSSTINPSSLEEGHYDCYLSYTHINGPDLLVAVWASKIDDYDTNLHSYNDGTIEVKIINKYLTIEVNKQL